MAATLTSRLSRLVIGKITPTQRPLASLRRAFDNNRFTSVTHSSAVATYNTYNSFHEKARDRTLSSMATQQTISATVANDFGATSSLSPLMSQKQAEDFAAFTYANRHQKGKECGRFSLDEALGFSSFLHSAIYFLTIHFS